MYYFYGGIVSLVTTYCLYLVLQLQLNFKSNLSLIFLSSLFEHHAEACRRRTSTCRLCRSLRTYTDCTNTNISAQCRPIERAWCSSARESTRHFHLYHLHVLFSHFGSLSYALQLGFFDPLGCVADGNEENFDRLRWVELKHGRIAMLAVVGYLVTYAGVRFPGAEDIPSGFAALDNLPGMVWAQMIATWSIMEAANQDQY